MCATCGCMKPKDKHGEKTLATANKKFAVKKAAKPYNKANDVAQDDATTRGLSKSEKVKFEKMDKQHRKPVNQKEDSYMDKANVERIKERERAVKAKEKPTEKKAEAKKPKKKK